MSNQSWYPGEAPKPRQPQAPYPQPPQAPQHGPQPQASQTPQWQPAVSTYSYPPPAPGAMPSGQPPAAPVATTGSRRSRAWASRIVTAAAVVALGLGSGAGGALYVTQHQSGPAAVTTVTRVVQGNTSAPDWAATAAQVLPSTVSVEVRGRSGTAEGSGVIWDTAGHIVTNNHVVAALGSGTPTITVTLSDGTSLDATIVATDATHDLAVLKLTNPPSGLTPIQMGDETTLKVGDPVMAVGNPLGLSETVTTGIVSALNRAVPTGQSTRGQSATTTNAIQVSAPINPGNSGGALVDSAGRLVGINFSIAALSQDSGSIGLGFAIPISEVRQVVTTLLTTGK